MSKSALQTEQEAQTKQKYSSTDNRVLPTLINKEQLNTIITNKDGTPDYLAINIYFDTLRSWYNPKIGYKKDGNLYHINKLKTPGIFLNYTRLAEIHGCSKETVRQKIVKLEHLGLVHRSFQHKETSTTKSYNGLIAYVWKDTPYFYNPMGIDSNQVFELTPQTNHEYIERRYGVSFGSLAPQNKGINIGGGIQACLDTKELNNQISKDIRSNVHTHESNFLENTQEIKQEENTDPQIVELPKEPAKLAKLKTRPFNERKKRTNAQAKARIYRFNQYKEPQDLKHHYPLTKEDGDKLQNLSGRDFSLNAMNEILLDMSKRLDNSFCSKAQFLVYFGKCLRFEMRDAVKTGNDNFRIKANITPINQKEIDKEKQIEQYLAEVEQNAITHVCPENQLKARIANVLEPIRAYTLLSNIKDLAVIGGIVRIYLRTDCQLSWHEKDVVLSQVQSIYSSPELEIESVEYLVENICKQTNGYDEVRTKTAVVMPILQQGVWGDICRKLIETCGVHVYNNWFSKLIPVIDEQKGTIELKAPNLFVKQWVETNYGEVITNILKKLGLELKELSGSYDLKRG
jgi:hypothetical protein